ncbi:hypothetical protein ccbrp13_46670 [Ktedonobacteria bacterium brp13]|nr:hypothetical protein ccbrp13_46670 [Ktedonobacteria bacterium brp13]
MLPVGLLSTILDVLKQLVDHYGVTVVLCTATQPDFSVTQQFREITRIREIVPEPARFFAMVQRVDYQIAGMQEGWCKFARCVGENLHIV